MTWKELNEKIDAYNLKTKLTVSGDFEELGETPETAFKTITSIVIGEYITQTYSPHFTDFNDDPIKAIVENKIINDLNYYVENVFKLFEYDYEKILDFIANHSNKTK